MRVVLLILALTAVAFLGWYGGSAKTSTDLDQAHNSTETDLQSASSNEPTKSNVASTIRCQGKLVPATGLIQIVAPVGSQVSELTDKSVGEQVLQGEVLATLQGREVRQRELMLAKARRSDAIKKADLEKEQAQFKLSSAKLAVEEAKAAAEKIGMEEQKIKLLERQLESNRAMLTKLQQIKSNPTTSPLLNQTDLEKQELIVAQLELQIEQAELAVEQARSSAARARVVAENNLNAVENGLKNATKALPLDSLNAAVELATAAWEMTELKSPIPNARILDIIVREGDSVTSKPVMVLGDTTEMHCIAEVSDQFLHRIKLETGRQIQATITSPAITKPLTGTVVRKGVMIGAPSLTDPNPFAKVDRRTGNVTIRLDDSEAAAGLVNLQVDVEITLDTNGNTEERSGEQK
jgi:HlyD family secretion protein